MKVQTTLKFDFCTFILFGLTAFKKTPKRGKCYVKTFIIISMAFSATPDGGVEIARPDKTAPGQTARLNNGGHEQSSP